MAEKSPVVEKLLENLGIGTNVLSDDDRPIVRIVVEGKVGGGKTALVSTIMKALEGKVKVAIEDDYTLNELKLHNGISSDGELKLYSPLVVLCERLTSNVPRKVVS